jgi:hypothetical protein
MILCGWDHREKQAAPQTMEKWDSMYKVELIPWGYSSLQSQKIFGNQILLMCLMTIYSWRQQLFFCYHIPSSTYVSIPLNYICTSSCFHIMCFILAFFCTWNTYPNTVLYWVLCSYRYSLNQEFPKNSIIIGSKPTSIGCIWQNRHLVQREENTSKATFKKLFKYIANFSSMICQNTTQTRYWEANRLKYSVNLKNVVVTFLSLWQNILDGQLKRRKDTAHVFTYFSPCSLGPIALDMWQNKTQWCKCHYILMEARKQERKVQGSQFPFQSPNFF